MRSCAEAFYSDVKAVVCSSAVKIPEHIGCLCIESIVSHTAGNVSERRCNVCFAYADRSEKEDIFPLVYICTAGKLFDPFDGYLWIEGEVKALQGFFFFKVRLLKPLQKASCLPSFIFVLKQDAQKIRISAVALFRLFKPDRQGLQYASQL